MNKYRGLSAFLKAAGAAVVVLMVFVGTASATTLTAPSGTVYTSTIKAVNEGSITIHGPANLTCNKSSFESKVEQHGSSVTAKGNISSLSFTECNQDVSVIAKGRLEFHPLSGGSGTVTAPGLLITVQFTTEAGNFHCVYGGLSADIGTLTAAPSNSGHAVLDLGAALIPVAGGDEACGGSAELTGKYKIVTPTGLLVETTPTGTSLTVNGVVSTPTIKAESEGALSLHATTTVTCQKSTLESKIEQHGAGVTANGKVSSFTLTECGTSKVTVNKTGALQIYAKGGGDGTVTWSGAEITIVMSTIFGNITCIFTTSNTHIGTLTGSSGHATLDIESAVIPRTGGTSLCGTYGEWTGSYKFTSPTGIEVDAV